MDEDDKVGSDQDGAMVNMLGESSPEEGSSEEIFCSSEDDHGSYSADGLEGVAVLFGPKEDNRSEGGSFTSEGRINPKDPISPPLSAPLNSGKACSRKSVEKATRVSGKRKGNPKRSKGARRELKNLDFNMSYGNSKLKRREVPSL